MNIDSQKMMESISKVVLAHLANNQHPAPAKLLPNQNELIARIAQSVVQASLSRAPSTPTLSVLSGAELSRNSSISSTSSLHSDGSLCSTPRDQTKKRRRSRQLDFGFGDDDDNHKRRRRAANPQDQADVDVVTRPVLAVFDFPYLALRKSDLFRKKFKRGKDANDHRQLKQNPDIVLPLFKKLVRPVLRRLLGSLHPGASSGDLSEIYRRYYTAALKVVKKRRANHIQSWRVHKCHKRLIYSTVPADTQRTERPPLALSQLDESQQPPTEDESQQPPTEEDESQQPTEEDESQQPDPLDDPDLPRNK